MRFRDWRLGLCILGMWTAGTAVAADGGPPWTRAYVDPCTEFVARLPNVKAPLCAAARLQPTFGRSVEGRTIHATDVVAPEPRLKVLVVGGMGSLPGAVAAGFLLGIVQSFASMSEVKQIIPGIDQIIIYLIAVVILLVRPRGLMGRRGMMEA